MSEHAIEHVTLLKTLRRIHRTSQLVEKLDVSNAKADQAFTLDQHREVLEHVAVALEDVPQDMHEAVRMLLMRPSEDHDKPLINAVYEVAMNAAGATAGITEELMSQLRCLHILDMLRLHKPYTYAVDGKLIRGSVPTQQKLKALYDAGCSTTINLCEELENGDRDIAPEGMRAVHVKIVDNTPPNTDQVSEVLDVIDGSSEAVYIHCEAGVGRTGTMVAAYRLRQGWGLEDTVTEAKNFGLSMPDQLAYIETLPAQGTARATEDQLRQTNVLNADPRGLDRVQSQIRS